MPDSGHSSMVVGSEMASTGSVDCGGCGEIGRILPLLELENEVANERLHRRHEDPGHDSEHVKAAWHLWAGERDGDIKCRGRRGAQRGGSFFFLLCDTRKQNLGGPSVYRGRVCMDEVRKKFSFWKKRSPNCNFLVLHSPSTLSTSKNV
jgi:hypothetical protein